MIKIIEMSNIKICPFYYFEEIQINRKRLKMVESSRNANDSFQFNGMALEYGHLIPWELWNAQEMMDVCPLMRYEIV